MSPPDTETTLYLVLSALPWSSARVLGQSVAAPEGSAGFMLLFGSFDAARAAFPDHEIASVRVPASWGRQ